MTTLDPKTARRVEAYAKFLGISADYFLGRVVNKWLDENGAYIGQKVEALRRADKKLPGTNRKKHRPLPNVASISPINRYVPPETYTEKRAASA